MNIALVHQTRPVLGVVYRPTTGELFWGMEGKGSFLVDASGTESPLQGGPHYSESKEIVVVASRSHLTEEVKAFVSDLEARGKVVEFVSAGSSLKLCLVAEGKAHVYPRLGPTMEWDTAAAHAVAVGAGKKVLNFESRQPLAYNKENLLNPWFIVE